MKQTKIILFYLFACVVVVGIFGQTPPLTDDVEYKIVMPQQTYVPGATARAWLLVINRGTLPIYVFRRFVHCSNFSVEFAEVKLLDKRGRNVDKEKECAMELSLKDPIAALADARSWIELEPGQAYGTEADVELPAQKGQYRLVSELFPPGFYDEYKEELAKRQMRVLRSRHLADSVAITIR